MATPTPAFPAAIADDTQLKVAANQITTTLKVSDDGTGTVLWIASATGFPANCLVSIDKEIIAVQSVAGSPNPSLTVAAGGRGFDGTTAAAHSAGAKVQLLIDAWHHNALAAEVKAIETFIGPNGNNLPTTAAALPASRYNFAPQSPGGSLIVGLNTVTLSPVPQGVNGNDTGHCLWITGGAGAAEAVTISGGTAVSGAASGTIFVTCANTHSGAWTIGSATAGVQEAVQTAQTAGGGTIEAGGATAITANCNITISGNYITLRLSGAGLILANNASIVLSGSYNSVLGMGNTPIKATGTTGDHIRLTGCTYCEIFGLRLDHSGVTAAGGAGIHLASGLSLELVVQSVSIYYCYRGIWFEVSGVASRWSDILVERAVMEGVRLDSANDEHFVNLEVLYSGSHGVQLGAGAATTYWPGATRIVNSVIYANGGDGIHIEGAPGTPCTYIFITNAHLDTDTQYELSIQNAGAISFANSQCINGKGVKIGTGAAGIQFGNIRINGSSLDGLYLTGGAKFINAAGLYVGDSSLGSGSVYAGIHIDGGVNNVAMTGVQVAQPDTPSGYGVQVTATGGSPTAVHITDLQLIASGIMTTPISVAPGLTDVFIESPASWQTITPSGGWTALAGDAAQCRLEWTGSAVRIRGTMQAGTTADGTVIFTLPAGYRPATAAAFACVVAGGAGTPSGTAYVSIGADGSTTIYGFGANLFLRLAGITFART